MVTLLELVAPLFMVSIGILLGAIFKSLPLKSLKLRTIALAVFAAIAGVGLAIPAFVFSNSLTYILFFDDFSLGLQSLPFFNTLGAGAPFAAATILIALFEVDLALGFGLAVKIDEFKIKRLKKKELEPVEPTKEKVVGVISSNGSSQLRNVLVSAKSIDLETAVFADEQVLRKDEQSMMELFLYGKISEIVPIVDSARPEGYFFDGIPQLDWDTKRSRQALDSLVRKGYLKAELVDKIIVCMACNSANVRIKKLCPECLSLRLRKEGLIEHFTCGTVDRQAAFETVNGDLACPKCKAKLQLVGSDYRILPPAYACLACNVRSNEPLLVVKCDDCGATAQLDEEPEVLLYKYVSNPDLPMQEVQQIKPVEVCANFFKSLGYTIVAPAFVSGRSGNQHLFDILILGRVGWIEPYDPTAAKTAIRKDNGTTVAQILISSKPIDVEEITRIYGMINDIDCDALIFAIPGVTENARNYASTYNMKISEGKTIEEALANSKIPKETPRASDKKA
ncbi:MAG: hypothetical protein NWE95_06575 [Candidatus Bathyarchaeota archaeon]|nr:hypothetical protein [Candidatus Bathyarchaeota archaeon]